MKQTDYTNDEIISGFKTRSREVIRFIYDRNFRVIKQFVLMNNGSVKDAEDHFHNVLLVVFEKIRKNDLNLNASFSTYLYSVSKIVWLKVLTKRKIELTTNAISEDIEDDNSELNELLEQVERQNLYYKHLKELSLACQKLLDLFLKGFSVSQITKILNYSSEQHTKNRRYRCKKSLITKIVSNPKFKELSYEQYNPADGLPRW